jgi:hypothetical protein
MKLALLFVFFISFSAFSYVPTVESLLRHGTNPDLAVNAMSISVAVKSEDGAREDFFKIYFHRPTRDVLRVAQARYSSGEFSDKSFLGKVYQSNVSPEIFKINGDDVARGLFFGILKSVLFNDGEFLVTYLKRLGAPVRLNAEILNRDKIELLASYKRYLFALNKDRSLRKTEANPLRPDDAPTRERVDRIMSEPMYVDMKQVALVREGNQMAWAITAGDFSAIVSHSEREIQKLKYKSASGEVEFQLLNYWRANGTHSVPRKMIVKDSLGSSFEVEILNLRHYGEREGDMAVRLKRWDSLPRSKEVGAPVPLFLLK